MSSLRAVGQLRDFVRKRLLDQIREEGNAESVAVPVALFARGLSTFEAIQTLAEGGYGAQVMMLNRSLFEFMIDLQWALEFSDEANAVFLRRARYDHYLRAQLAAEHHELLGIPKPEVEELPDQELIAAEKEFRRGTASWTGMSLHDRIQALKGSGEDPEAGEQLERWNVVVNKINNQEIHPSPWSLARLLEKEKDETGRERLKFRNAPEDELVDSALYATYFIFVLMAHPVILRFAPDLEHDFEAMLADHAPAFEPEER